MLSSNSRFSRGTPGVRTVAGLGVLAVVMAVALGLMAPGIAAAGEVPVTGKWGGPIDPDALQILKGMTDYLGSLQRFSMHTENSYEDVLATGQKIQFSFSSSIVAQRPDKLRAERTDGMARQLFVYDGEALSMYDGGPDFFSIIGVPDNLDDFLHFARDTLDLVPPTGDMVYTNAFELLTAGITSGFVVGKAVIGGVSCDQIAFTTPVVDWQVWIADGDTPLPYKYVLTTRDDPAQPQFVTYVSDWNADPKIGDGTFEFEPPATAMEIDFILPDAGTTSAR
jgi:hypothetical protein